MSKPNCWEFKNCGREPGGAKAEELGVCPAAVEKRANGLNGGKNGGRVCWAISGTLCKGKVQGTFARKLENCANCVFYKLVLLQEGDKLVRAGQIVARLK